LRINRAIRADKVRVIDQDGRQVGILTVRDALAQAERAGLDLVEISPNAKPPVCKIIDYGKFKYQQTKKEKESKKAQHQIKVKEIKVKPNIDQHDLQTKIKRAREFLSKGNKVRVTCMFRGREMLHIDVGDKVVRKICEELEDISQKEAPIKRFGRTLSTVLVPTKEKKSQKSSKET